MSSHVWKNFQGRILNRELLKPDISDVAAERVFLPEHQRGQGAYRERPLQVLASVGRGDAEADASGHEGAGRKADSHDRNPCT